jgi:hypothetical protein
MQLIEHIVKVSKKKTEREREKEKVNVQLLVTYACQVEYQED